MVLIKQAQKEQLGDLIGLAREMVAEGAFAFAPVDATKIAYLFGLQHSVAFLAYLDDYPIGFIAGIVQPFFWSNYARVTDLGFFLRPQFRGGTAAMRLLEAFEAWAKTQPVEYITIGHSVGGKIDQMRTFYMRNGYLVGGFNTLKRIK